MKSPTPEQKYPNWEFWLMMLVLIMLVCSAVNILGIYAEP